MGELSKLPNIGKDTERQLVEAGVPDYATLAGLGAKQAWLRLQQRDASACLHRLMGLEGAIRGVKKTDLPQETKDDLKAFYQAHKL